MPKRNNSGQLSILFVINPVSGDVGKTEFEGKIKHFSDKNKFSYEIYYTKGEKDKEELKKKLKLYKPDRVVSVGGDGTCNMTAHVLINSDIPLGIIPLGSANGLAKELDLPEVVDECFDVISGRCIKPIDVLKINDEHISLHLSDIGVNAEVVNRFEKDNTRGLIGYAKHFFLELFKAKPHHFQIKSDNREINQKAHMVVIANASKYGTGAVINPNGKLDDGVFEIILIRPYKFHHLLQMIVPFFTQKLDRLDYVDVYSFKKVSISNNNKRVLQIDGEVIGQLDTVNVEIIPQCLQVICT